MRTHFLLAAALTFLISGLVTGVINAQENKCKGLATASFTNLNITSAIHHSATESAPEHCEVLAAIPPQTEDGYPINLRVVLPSDWSGRTVQFGGGGYNGFIPPHDGATWQTPEAKKNFPFKRHATFSGDSGHQSDSLFSASFALNKEALMNYAGESIKKTRDAAMAIIKAYFGKMPEKTYFVGFSNGGREALVAAEKYPQDYDGILAGDPVASVSMLSINHHKAVSGFYKNEGAAWVNGAKAKLISKAIYDQCDPADGLEDGWIADFEGCKPDLSVLRCPSGTDEGDQCLSDAQINAINNVHADLKLSYELANGVTGMPGYPWGNVGWDSVFLGSRPTPSVPVPNVGGQDAFLYTLADSYIRFFIARDPQFDSIEFDPEDPDFRERIIEVSKMIDATDPDLSEFYNRGSKLIIYAGGSSSVPPAATVQYWNSVIDTMGKDKVSEFARFYVFPSVNHMGMLNPGLPSATDLFSTIESWVESGILPGKLINTSANENPAAKRPLCEYPDYPRYNGTGDPTKAESFTCTPPVKSVW